MSRSEAAFSRVTINHERDSLSAGVLRSCSRIELNGCERWRQLLGARLNGVRNGDRKTPVALQHAPCAEHGQPHDPTSSRCVADDVALWRLVPLARLRLADMQIQQSLSAS